MFDPEPVGGRARLREGLALGVAHAVDALGELHLDQGVPAVRGDRSGGEGVDRPDDSGDLPGLLRHRGHGRRSELSAFGGGDDYGAGRTARLRELPGE